MTRPEKAEETVTPRLVYSKNSRTRIARSIAPLARSPTGSRVSLRQRRLHKRLAALFVARPLAYTLIEKWVDALTHLVETDLTRLG